MTTVKRMLLAEDGETRQRAAALALYGGIVIFFGKLLAFLVTDSTAIFSDALESIVNVVTAGFLVYSIKLAATPADRSHPYGHGKVEFFAAGVEGTLIGVAALLIFVKSIRDLWQGPQIHQIDLGLALLATFSLGNALLGAHLIRAGKKVDSLALRADGLHLLTDVLTSVGVMVGLVLVRVTGWTFFDPLAAIVVALNILRTGVSLSREAISGLMDEADIGFLEELTRNLERARESWWIDIHSLRAWRSGSLRHVDFHLCVPRYYDAEQLHEIDEDVHEKALESQAIPRDIIIHFDPCRPRHCSHCKMDPCPARTTALAERDPFTLHSVTRGDEDLDGGMPLDPEVLHE